MLVTGRGVSLEAGSWLAQGGQGVIYEVVRRPDLVFKRYKPAELEQDATLRDRLEVMVNQPVPWREARSQHVMLAWPTDSVFEDSRFVGYLMPRIDAGRSARLLRVWDPSDRELAEAPMDWLRGFNWRYLVTTGSNLALGLEVLHASDVVIGDFNDANVAVTPEARVTFFDCDSMQLSDSATGRRFLCRVTRPEFTAPELIGVDLQTTFRTRSSDLFALAVHLYQLLLEGEHPFRGNWHGDDDPPREQVLAREGLWTYAGRTELTPRPTAIGLEVLPREIAELFRRAFVEGAHDPERRPSAAEWRDALDQLGSVLIPCGSSAQHWFPFSFSQCPWCRHARGQARLASAPPARPGRGSSRPSSRRSPPPAVASRRPAVGGSPSAWPTVHRRRRSALKVLLPCAGVIVLLAAGVLLLAHFHILHVNFHHLRLHF
jgi:DNA-binding helix-hairpin-helix protein with protein kinase domain